KKVPGRIQALTVAALELAARAPLSTSGPVPHSCRAEFESAEEGSLDGYTSMSFPPPDASGPQETHIQTRCFNRSFALFAYVQTGWDIACNPEDVWNNKFPVDIKVLLT